MEEHSLLLSVFIYLLAAVVAVPVAKKLGLGAVLGYLLAGILIGPWVLKLITETTHVLHFAEFGVVMLLFLIGLELNPSKLWEMRRPIIGHGGSQVLISTMAIAGVALLLGLRWEYALVAGMALALSSTAIVLQIMDEKNLMPTPTGQSGFSILLFQDIAVIPMLAILPLLSVTGSGSEAGGVLGVIKALTALVLIYLIGRYLLPPIFRYIAATRMREVFTAFTLLLVVGVAALMDAVGLSMALGTFMVGVLLSESKYRHELEANIEPFKGLLLGLFFISVGMTVNFGLLFDNPLLIIGLVVSLIAIKALILYLVSVKGKLPSAARLRFAILLSQGGEFAFVILSQATAVAAIDTHSAEILTVVVALSMMTTPLLMLVVERYCTPATIDSEKPVMDIPNEQNEVIIAGFGRVGQIIARMIGARNIGTTILDHNSAHIERISKFGFKAYYGDATRMDLLETAGIADAKILVIALDDNDQAVELAREAKRLYPHLKILSRSWDVAHAIELMKVGVEMPQRETMYSSLKLAEEVLTNLGYGAFEARQVTAKFERHDLEILHGIYDAETLEDRISIGRDLRGKFEAQMKSDAEYREQAEPDWS